MGLCASTERVMPIRQIMATLAHIPLFSHLDEPQLRVLAEEFTASHVDPGQIIFAEGDPGTSLFIIAQGSVRVTATSREGEDSFLAEWAAPYAFGEIALLREASQRTATVHAGAGGILLVMTQTRFSRLVHRHPWMEAVTQRMGSVANHRMALFLKDIPFLSLIDDRQLDTLGALFSYERAEAGDEVCTEGQPGDKFYILSRGKVAVSTADTPLVTLSEGAHFGEMALLSKTPRTATVTATETCMLLSLPRDAFVNFLAVVPHARAHLHTMMRARAAANLRGLACPLFQGMSDGQLDLLAKLCASASFSAGDVVTRQGDPADAFLVVVHGSADAFVDPTLGLSIAAAESARQDAVVLDPAAPPARHTLPPVPGADSDDDGTGADGNADAGAGGARSGGAIDGLLGAIRSRSRVKARAHGARVAVLAPGSYVGDASLLFDLPCASTVVAREDLTVLRFPRPLFRQIFAANASAAAEFLLRIDPGAASLEVVLVHATARALFMQHLKAEFSSESLEFFLESQRLIDDHFATPDVVLSGAKALAAKFIKNGAERQVNVKDRVRRGVEKTLSETTDVTVFPPCLWASRLFFEARLELFKLMERDGFPRFREGPLFARLLVLLRSYALTHPLPGVPAPMPSLPAPPASPALRPASTPNGHPAPIGTPRGAARRASTGGAGGPATETRLLPGVPLLAPLLALLPPARLGLPDSTGGAGPARPPTVSRAVSFNVNSIRHADDPATPASPPTPRSPKPADAASSSAVKTHSIQDGAFAVATKRAARVVLGLRAPRSGNTPTPRSSGAAQGARSAPRRSSSVPSLLEGTAAQAVERVQPGTRRSTQERPGVARPASRSRGLTVGAAGRTVSTNATLTHV